ncbi:putative RNA polymerase II subunit B1 CTD phosphatase rpap2 [Rhipicephalus sanguineus]|uniref:putative RNA polymerase II subunit B1 CTD phosphatase rpap2 n=1 Tax=Rhipicephalus sanguineus TaxID=34632 RepID=UPI0018941652|nr:putative RNA polymerase II subunit B1 CTD phosphatase rpap2 [Rhipicephalus sanguineus]
MEKPETKSATTSERRQAILKTIERRDSCKKRAAQIVEEMLESSLSEEWLLGVLHELSQQDYQDAVEERTIVRLCGYPLCNKNIAQVPKQQYHICMKTKKVYDITHRKQYCSNTCYRASTFLKGQLWDGPLWLRDEADTTAKYNVYREEENLARSTKKDGRGEEVDLGHSRLAEKDVEGPQESKPADMLKPAKDVSPYVTPDALKKLAESIDKMSVRSQKSPAQARNIEESATEDHEREDGLEPDNEIRSTDVRPPVEASSPPSNDEPAAAQKVTSPARRSVPSRNDKSWQNALASEQARAAKASTAKSDTDGPPIERVQQALKQWITAETVAFLVGDGAARRFRINNRRQEEAMKVERYHALYSKLCKRLDEQEKAEERLAAAPLDSDDDEDAPVPTKPTAPVPTMEQLRRDSEKKKLEIRERHQDTFEKKDVCARTKESAATLGSKKGGGKPRKEKKVENTNTTDSCEREPILPLVDSHAQNVHRRRIVFNWLRKALPDILDILYMDLSEVSSYLTELILTFRLSAENITFRLETWAHIAAGILVMLSRKCPPLNSAIMMEESRRRFSIFLEDNGLSLQNLTYVVDDLLGS